MDNIQLIMDVNNELSFTMAARLKQLREEAGLSHQKLSDALDEMQMPHISRDSLINYEVASEHHTAAFKNLGMSISKLHALATFYNVSTDYILGLTDTKSPSTDVQTACQITGLNEHSINCLLGFMESNDDKHFSYREEYGDLADYAFAMVNEFIAFALDYNEGFGFPFDRYLAFRDQTNRNNKEKVTYEQMNPDEKEHYSAKFIEAFRFMHSDDSGFYPLITADAADFFRTEFCDSFKNYLKAKHPLK